MELEQMTLSEIWKTIKQIAQQQPIEVFKGLEAKALFKISGADSGDYTIMFTKESVTVAEQCDEDSDVIFEMNINNFKKLLQGKLNGLTAYMSGRLAIKGDIKVAIKLESMMKEVMRKL